MNHTAEAFCPTLVARIHIGIDPAFGIPTGVAIVTCSAKDGGTALLDNCKEIDNPTELWQLKPVLSNFVHSTRIKLVSPSEPGSTYKKCRQISGATRKCYII